MGWVLVQPAGTSIFPAGSSSLVACDAHGIAALLAPSPTGNIDVADPSHFPDRLLAPIEADRPGAAHKDVEQAADHRQILEEMKVLVLILIGRHRPELVSDERGADGEGGEQQGR